jgi:flagellar biosynthesis/type III secretory pathway protein FliH
MRPIPIAQYLNQFGKANGAALPPPQVQSLLLKPRPLPPAPPQINIDAELAEAAERGRQMALEAARAEFAAALDLERKSWEEGEAARRIAWQATEYAVFADKIERAMAAIEDRVAQAVARILKPFLNEERAKQITESLSENLSRILSGDAPATLKITGPQALLSLLRDKVSVHAVNVEYVPSAGVDVTVEANQTIIQSQLQAWIDHIASIGE